MKSLREKSTVKPTDEIRKNAGEKSFSELLIQEMYLEVGDFIKTKNRKDVLEVTKFEDLRKHPKKAEMHYKIHNPESEGSLSEEGSTSYNNILSVYKDWKNGFIKPSDRR